MNLHLEKELIKISAQRHLPTNKKGKVLKPTDLSITVNSLLKDAQNRDVNFLVNRGFDNLTSKEKLDTMQKEALEKYENSIKNYNEVLNANPFDVSYTVNTIRELALNFNLRYLPVKFFNGELPSDVVQKIEKFEESLPKIKKTPDIFSYQPYPPDSEEKTTPKVTYKILAPKTFFNLKKRPVPVHKDPLLFGEYKDQQGILHIMLVHKWGSNHMTHLRRIPMMFWNNSDKFVSIRVLPIVVAILPYVFYFIKHILHIDNVSDNIPGFIVASAVIGAFLFIITLLAMCGLDDIRVRYVNNWDEPFK